MKAINIFVTYLIVIYNIKSNHLSELKLIFVLFLF